MVSEISGSQGGKYEDDLSSGMLHYADTLKLTKVSEIHTPPPARL
jgi:hypothetical protein